MNVIRFPSIHKVRRGFAYGGKTYVSMDYVLQSMTPKERARLTAPTELQPIKRSLQDRGMLPSRGKQ
jgi:hypothetical protein